MIAATKGHVCILDECDKASPQVVASLKGLVGGFMRLPDGRTLVSKENLHLAAADDRCVVLHPKFRLVMLANPGVAPFLGSNVLETLGSLTNCILMESPSLESMKTILRPYAKSAAALGAVDSVAAAFGELCRLNLSGELQYAYGLREAISVVKDLNDSSSSVESAIANVFDYELQPEARRIVAEVLKRHRLLVEGSASSFQAGPGRQRERLQIDGAVPREAAQNDAKHGKASDGKEHVGGKYEDICFFSSSLNYKKKKKKHLGRRHGRQLDCRTRRTTRAVSSRSGQVRCAPGTRKKLAKKKSLLTFIHKQVREEDKIWTDKAAEARARQVCAKRLKSISCLIAARWRAMGWSGG